jgi:oxygen-dependent protoporphyrinogen oxidase
MKDPEILDRGDDELGDRATREFEAVVGESARVLSVSRWEQGFPAYDASWDALDSLSVPRGIDLLTNYTARAGVSSRITQAKRFAERLASDRDRKGAPSTRQPSTTR